MSYEVSDLYPPVFQIKYVPRRPPRMTLIAFKILRQTSLLALLPEDLVRYVLLGYLCEQIGHQYCLFGEPHSPQRIESGRIVTAPAIATPYPLYYRHGVFHSYDDLPAEVTECTRRWYRNGELHREGAPAIIQILNKKTRETFEVWCRRGVRHRDDGAAYISKKFQRWYRNGQLHREDGPAIAGPRYDHWYTNGILIRTIEH